MGTIRVRRVETTFVLMLASVFSCAAFGDNTSDKLNILGIRIGMSAADAKAALKAQRMPHYQDFTQELVFSSLSGAFKPVPAGKFQAAAATFSNSTNSQFPPELLTVYFTPVPGKEQVASVSRTVQNANGLLESRFVQALTEKYGPPDLTNSGAEPSWAWGITPALKKKLTSSYQADGSGMYQFRAVCTTLIPDPYGSTVMSNGAKAALELPMITNNPSVLLVDSNATAMRARADKCASSFLIVDGIRWSGTSATNRPGERLIERYRLMLIGSSVTAEAYEAALALTMAAKEAERQEQLNLAKDKKGPTL